MKPHYKYSSAITEAINIGDSARIFTIDHPVFGSEWVYPNRTKYKFACCDCGLVHDMQFSLIKRGLGKAIVFRARRNNRSTGQMRRNMK